MNVQTSPTIDWPELSPIQRACADAAASGLGVDARQGAIAARALSARSGFVILLTGEDGSRSLLKVSPDGAPDEIATEYSVMRQLGGGYAARVRAYVDMDRTSALLLHWLEADSLSTRWGSSASTADTRRQDLRVVAEALTGLHGEGIIHGDLQPTHIRFAQREATLIDFGVSGPPGSPFGGGLIHFLAPEYASEIIEGRKPVRTKAGDWYALLASAFVALTGEAPVTYANGADREDKLTAIVARAIDPSDWEDPFARDVAEALLLPADLRGDWVLERRS